MPYTAMQMAEAFIQTGELPDALDALNQHLEANPGDDDARRLRVQVLMRLRDTGSYYAAIEDIDRLKSLSSQDRMNRYIIFDQLEDHVRALDTIEDLYDDDLTNERVAELLFERAVAQREYGLSAQVLKAMPRTSGWLTKAGDLARAEGRFQDAVTQYTEALKQLSVEFDLATSQFARPIHTDILLARAEIYVTLGKLHKASEDYAAAQAVMPDDAFIGFWHSYVQLDLGHVQEAVVTCRLALETANDYLKSQMVNNLRSRADDPKFAPLVALLDELSLE